jgi:hypothetical protein
MRHILVLLLLAGCATYSPEVADRYYRYANSSLPRTDLAQTAERVILTDRTFTTYVTIDQRNLSPKDLKDYLENSEEIWKKETSNICWNQDFKTLSSQGYSFQANVTVHEQRSGAVNSGVVYITPSLCRDMGL